jgi:MFS family permease
VTQPERPVPVIQLPGLPPRSIPKDIVKSDPKNWPEVSKNWLAQLLPFKKVREVAPPTYTPRTAKFHDARRQHQSLEDFDDTLEDDSYDFKPTPPPLYTKEPPEGGLVAWLAVAGAFLLQFCTIGYFFTWNVFEGQYNHVTLTDHHPAAVRWIGSFQLFFALAQSLQAGRLADAGYFKHVVMAGSGLFVICLFLLSFIPEEQFFLVFLCQAVGMGTGMGLVFVPSSTFALHYFKRWRGLALGIVMSGGAFGGVIFPPILRCLIPQHGLSGAIRVTAYIIFVALLIATGLLIIPNRTDRGKLPLPHIQLTKYSTDMCYIFAGIGTCLAVLVLFFPTMYLELLGLEKGADPITAFNSSIVLSLTGIIGGILFGFVSDLYGIWNIMIPVSGGLALTLFTMCAIQGPKSLVAHSIFYGFFSGAWLSLMVTALSSLATKVEEMGTRVGLVLTGSSFFALLSFAVQYALLGSKFNWTAPSVFSGFLLLGVMGLAYLSRTKLAVAKIRTGERRQYIKGILIL